MAPALPDHCPHCDPDAFANGNARTVTTPCPDCGPDPFTCCERHAGYADPQPVADASAYHISNAYYGPTLSNARAEPHTDAQRLPRPVLD